MSILYLFSLFLCPCLFSSVVNCTVRTTTASPVKLIKERKSCHFSPTSSCNLIHSAIQYAVDSVGGIHSDSADTNKFCQTLFLLRSNLLGYAWIYIQSENETANPWLEWQRMETPSFCDSPFTYVYLFHLRSQGMEDKCAWLWYSEVLSHKARYLSSACSSLSVITALPVLYHSFAFVYIRLESNIYPFLSHRLSLIDTPRANPEKISEKYPPS